MKKQTYDLDACASHYHHGKRGLKWHVGSLAFYTEGSIMLHMSVASVYHALATLSKKVYLN